MAESDPAGMFHPRRWNLESDSMSGGGADGPTWQPRQAATSQSQPRGRTRLSTHLLLQAGVAVLAIVMLAGCGAAKASPSSGPATAATPASSSVGEVPVTISPRAASSAGRSLFYRHVKTNATSTTTDQQTIYEDGSHISLWDNGALTFLVSKGSADYQAFFCGIPPGASSTVCATESAPLNNNVFAFITDAYLHPFAKDSLEQGVLQVTTTNTEQIAGIPSKCEIGAMVGGGQGKLCAALVGGYLTYDYASTATYTISRSTTGVPRDAFTLPAGATICRKADPHCG